MSAPESVRDRLARRAKEIRTEAARAMLDREHGEAVAAHLGTARALEEIVAALDAFSGDWRPENAPESAHKPAHGENVVDPVGGEGSDRNAAWAASWGRK